MRVIFLSIFLIFFAGCSLKHEGRQNVYLKILPDENVKVYEQKSKKVIQIRQIFEGDTRLVYIDKNGFYDSYAHHVWSESLGAQIQELLVADLQKSNLFRDVATNNNIIISNLYLEVDIFNFEQYLKDGESSQILFNARVRVLDVNNNSLANKPFTCRYDIAITNPVETLQGYNSCYRAFSKELLEWLNDNAF